MPILVSNVYPPDRGGIQTMMAAFAEVAVRAGRDVVVVAPGMTGSDAFDESAPYRVLRFPDLWKPANAIALSIAFVRALTIARDRTTFAANWWPSALFLVVVPKIFRGKLAVFAHGSDVAPGKGGLRRVAMRFVCARADAVLANSTFTKALLERAGISRRVSIVPLGVDVPPIEPDRAPDPTILSVGRLVERKGFDRIIESLGALAQRFPAVRYEIVGDGPYRATLEALALRCGVADRVAFRGKVSQADMERAYARAWCFALPVREVGNDVEGFGLVYLEAAMARLPTIGGLYSGASDAIEDGVTGLLVEGNDVAAVTAALARLLGNEEEAKRMGERGFERARTFTWQRCFESATAAVAP